MPRDASSVSGRSGRLALAARPAGARAGGPERPAGKGHQGRRRTRSRRSVVQIETHRRHRPDRPPAAQGHAGSARASARPPASSSPPTATSSPAPSTSPTSRRPSSSPCPATRNRYVAKVVATDQTRMLTLLKIDANGAAGAGRGAEEGHARSASGRIALGRTLDRRGPRRPAAVGQRRHHQRRQPHLGQGDPDRRQGVAGQLRRPAGRHPAAGCRASSCRPRRAARARRPASSGTTPASASPSRWKTSSPCCRGCTRARTCTRGPARRHACRAPTCTRAAPIVGTVAPDSAAAKAGLKPGDVIVEIDGKPVRNQAQLQHLLGPKYEGDKVAVDDQARRRERSSSTSVKLAGSLAVVRARRSSASCRCATTRSSASRFATSIPKSPAATAGLKAGDRIVKVGAPASTMPAAVHRAAISSTQSALNRAAPGHRDQARGGPQGRRQDRDADRQAGSTRARRRARQAARQGQRSARPWNQAARTTAVPNPRPRTTRRSPRPACSSAPTPPATTTTGSTSPRITTRTSPTPWWSGCTRSARARTRTSRTIAGRLGRLLQRQPHHPGRAAGRQRDRLGRQRGRLRAGGGPRRAWASTPSTGSAWWRTAWASAGRWRSTSASTPATCSAAWPPPAPYWRARSRTTSPISR